MSGNDENVSAVPAYAIRREDCRRYLFAGGVWIILADAARTFGRIANLEAIYARGGGLPALIREREVEFAYVIKGRLRVSIGDAQDCFAEPGALIYVPRGIRRRYTATEDDTRVYYGLVPAGAESLIEHSGCLTTEMSVPLHSYTVDTRAAEALGIRIAPEWCDTRCHSP